MKSKNRKNRKSNGRNQKLTMESLEDRRLLATVSGATLLSPSDLSPSVQSAFEQSSDLTQYTPLQLQESDWVVRLNSGHSTSEISTALKLANGQLQATDLIDRTYVIANSAGHPTLIEKLGDMNAVEYFYPLVNSQVVTKLVPNDPLFENQWHLQNTGQSGGTSGEDANIVNAWNNFTGAGVQIAVVDDGVDGSHPDLNYRTDLSFDYGDNDADASPLDTDSHGTAVAGVAAATGNNSIGVVGAGFGAEIAGIRLLVPGGFGDVEEAGALSHQGNEIDIYNNSWGPTENIARYAAPGPLAAAALEAAAEDGRNGLGSIHVWAAGNGLEANDNSNYDGYANSPFTIAVTAVNHFGTQSSYAEPGANILIAAPSNAPGITTIDNVGDAGETPFTGETGAIIPDNDPSNYRSDFGGTSSAAPVVSGVIALMLEANPRLTYRDVEHILIETARQNDANDSDWTVNGDGHNINHKYGFGVIDAEAAVEAAITWGNVGTEINVAVSADGVNQDIPDNNAVGTQFTITVPATLENDGGSLAAFSLEHVQLDLDTSHMQRGDLQVELTSPSGTVSVLATAHAGDFGELNWVYDSVRHWGESPVGDWTVRIADRLAGDVGQLESARLVFSGTDAAGLITTGTIVTIKPPTDNGVITGTVFNDTDNDGINDESEAGIQGHTVFLDANNNGLLDDGETTSVTGSTGNYFLTGLPIGTYTVGYVCNVNTNGVNLATTTTQTAIVGLGGISVNNDFAANEDCLPVDQVEQVTQTAIEGVVYDDADGDGVQDADENGIAGMTVYADLNNNCIIGLGEPAGVTDANGHYTVAVDAGSHFMRLVPRPGLELSACQGTSVTAPGDVATNHNIGFAAENQFDYGMDESAKHGIYPGIHLGNIVSGDPTIDDNDGVIFTSGLTPGQTEQVIIVAKKLAVSTAYLQGWIDWNGDGDFSDAGEQIFRNTNLTNGINRFDLNVPSNAATTGINAVFRYGFELGIGPNSPALGGEAEHYVLNLPMQGDTGITANDDTASVAAGGSVTISPLANDAAGPLGGDLTITSVSSTDAKIVDNTIVFTPGENATDPETFTYTIMDTLGGTATATVSVNVVFDFPVAAGDTAAVLTSSQGNEINVLANDKDSPTTTVASTITAVQSSTDQGGTASISSDAMTILYTPAAEFEGSDSFTYTITDENGDTDTATVNVTVTPSGPLVEMTLVATDLNGKPIEGAIQTGQEFQLRGFVEDLRDMPTGAFSAYLDVALSDAGLVTLGAISYGAEYTNNQSGSVAAGLIDEVGGQGGPDEIEDPTNPTGQFHLFTVNMTAASEGTLTFTGNPADILPANETSVYGLNSPVPDSLIKFVDDSIDIERAPKVDFIFDVVNLAGNPVDNVAVGQEFVLNISVQDLTNRTQAGVFSAFLDVLYDSTLVSMNGDVTYGTNYPNSQAGDATSTPGLIDELGGADGTTPLGSDPVLLVSIPLKALAAGQAAFTGNEADTTPPHETTLFGESTFVNPLDMRFSSDSVTIGNTTAALSATYTNVSNRMDVTGDGFVSPIDALAIINDLNENGSRALPTTTSDKQTQLKSFVPKTLVDVNNDGYVSPIDALLVINELNKPATSNPQAALSSVAFVADADESEDEASSNTDKVLSVWSSFDSVADDDSDDEWVVEVASTTVNMARR